YWPAMAGAKGNEWASDIPLNVRERIQADWVTEMEKQGVFSRENNWYIQGVEDAGHVAALDVDAMKKAAAGVKKLGLTREAQAGRELWQELLPGLMERIDFSPAQINRDFWAAVDKTAMAYADVPKWMDD